MPVQQSQGLEDRNSFLMSCGIKFQQLSHLFNKGLSTGILFPQDIFGALPGKAKRDRTMANKILDWLFDCFEQLHIKVVSEKGKPPLKLKYVTDSLIDVLLPSTPKEEEVQRVLGTTTFSLFKALAISRKNRDKQKKLELRNKIVKLNLGLVYEMSNYYSFAVINGSLSRDDLTQEGILGLMKAIDRFDYLRGNQFSTYATWWIRQAITRALADQSRTIRIPVHMVEMISKYKQVRRRLTQELSHKPLPEEISIEMGISVKTVIHIQKISQDMVSLEAPVGEDKDSSTISEFIPDEKSPDPSQITSQTLLREQIIKILANLTPREQKIIKMRFGLEDGIAHSLEEVGKECGVTRERIRQQEEKILRKLSHPHNLKKLAKITGIKVSDIKGVIRVDLGGELNKKAKYKIRQLLIKNISYVNTLPRRQRQYLKAYFGIKRGKYKSSWEIERKLSIGPIQVLRSIQKGINKLPKFIQEEILVILKENKGSLSQ